MKKTIVMLLVIFIVVACGGLFALQKTNQPVSSPQHAAFWAEVTESCGDDITYFSDYHKLEGYEDDRVNLIIAGLESDNPVVRWIAAYQSLQYMGTAHAPRLTTALAKVNDDPNMDVRLAVRFGISFNDGNYKYHPWMKASPDNNLHVYHRYQAAQYNDGQVWQVRNGRSSLLQEVAGSINDISFSPDSKLLAVTYGGRNWGSLDIIDIASGSAVEVLPWPFLQSLGVEVFDSHPRPDPYVVFREWSATSSEVLLYYAYHNEDYERMYGYAVFDVALGKVVRGIKPQLQTDAAEVNKAELDWR